MANVGMDIVFFLGGGAAFSGVLTMGGLLWYYNGRDTLRSW